MPCKRITRRQALQRCGAAAGASIAAGLMAPSSSAHSPSAAARRPNVLFVLSDDQSAHASAYGTKGLSSPAFDRLAREGVLFNRTYCACPSCSPSRAAVLTGRPIWALEQAGCFGNVLPKKFHMYPLLLKDADYHVGWTGKGWGPGDLPGGGWGRGEYPMGRCYNAKRVSQAVQRRLKVFPFDYAANFKQFLTDRPADAPFCFWAGLTEPHRPYAAGSGKRAGKKLSDVDVPAFLPDTPEVRSDLLDYYLKTEYADKQFGRILDILDKGGLSDNTLVVYTSDNGLAVPRCKANLYDMGVRMPMAARWPARVRGGRTVDDFINLIDLAPTFLEAAGLKVPADMIGRSMMDVLTSKKSGQVDPKRDRTFTGIEQHGPHYPVRAMHTSRYGYLRNFEPDRWPGGKEVAAKPTATMDERLIRLAYAKRPAEELYDLHTDPFQLNNLAGEAEHAQTLAKMRKDLTEYLTRTGDPRMKGRAPFDRWGFHGRQNWRVSAFGCRFNVPR